MNAHRTILATLPALLAWGAGARDVRAAADAPPIRIDVRTCPAAWDLEIRLALAVEIGDEHLAEPPGAEEPADRDSGGVDAVGGQRLSIRCAERRVWVVVYDVKTAATREQTLTGDLPAETASRVIALVAADLLTAFDPALRGRLDRQGKPIEAVSAAPPPLARPTEPVSAAPAAPSPSSTRRPLSLSVGGVFRTFLSNGGVDAWGGVVDARHASQDGRWALGVGVEIAGAGRSTSIGETTALLASARATAGVRIGLARDQVALRFDLGARAGAARLSGRSDDPNVRASTLVRPWAGPVATLGAELGPSWLWAEIIAEGGWAAASASGGVNGGPALAVNGPWVAFSVGVGHRR